MPTIFCLLLIVVEVRLLLQDELFHPTSTRAERSEAIATFQSSQNTVLRKTLGTLVWEPPKVDMALYREDAIATMENAEARIVFKDQSELLIEPNSLIILEQAPSGIVLRLVKGSVRRKNQGKTPLFIKLSRAPDAKAIQLDDPTGHSVFRVIYKIEGYDIVVESGSITVDQKTVVDPDTKTRLKAPRLNKPKIEIVDPDAGRKRSSLWDWFLPSAEAARGKSTGPKQIQIHFSWEPVPDAKAYRVQVSKDPSFNEVLKEGEVQNADFTFSLPAPEAKDELFFHVAAIDEQGALGEFSSVEKIEVNPVPVSTQMPEPKLAVEPPSVQKTAVVAKGIPSPTPVLKNQPVLKNDLWLGYSVEYDRRSFKNDVANPREASGGGIVPTKLAVEFRHAYDAETSFRLGGSYLFEQATPDLPAPSNQALSTAKVRAWATYGLGQWSIGPYFSTTKRFTNSGLLYAVETKLIYGVVAAIQNEMESAISGRGFWWRAQAALIPLGAMGIDVSVFARKRLAQDGFFRDLYGSLELGTRLSNLESAWDASAGLGFWY